jgi:hypothetical protein
VVLWRVHVELADRPGALGELATAVGGAGCNIISLHVVGEPADDGSVTDELLVEVPGGVSPATLVEHIEAATIPCTLLVRADAGELSDPVTTALAFAATSPKSQRSVPAAFEQLPWLGVAEVKLIPSGKISVRRTVVAVFVPRFVTLKV